MSISSFNYRVQKSPVTSLGGGTSRVTPSRGITPELNTFFVAVLQAHDKRRVISGTESLSFK